MNAPVGAAPSGPPGGSAPHILVPDLAALEPDLETWHHLLRVRRLRIGDSLTATDGRGRWVACRLASESALVVDGDVVSLPRPEPEIVVAFALTKGDKPELVIQKLTELGVDRIVPFRAARSVVRWDGAKADAAHRRWEAIARGALEQSRRCWAPVVDPIGDLASVAGLGAVRVDRGGAPPSLARSVVAVGPEGGWESGERDMLPTSMDLGPHVLRAETAAVTAGVVLCSLRSGLVAELPTGPAGDKKDR